MIITNFKTYAEATGPKAVALARIHAEVARQTGASLMVAAQAADIAVISAAVSIPVLAQHIDAAEFGSATGHILPESVQMAGAKGTLLNHSEKRLERVYLRRCVERAKQLGLVTIVCAATPEEGATFLEFEPDFIAVEPPDLIGGNVSVTTRPDVIAKAVKLIGGDKLLVGAGVKNGEDVKKAMQLGAAGVLLASGVTKAVDPKAVLLDLAGGLV